MFAKPLNSLRKFHSDEEGLEALQVVMIIAIAAMVMIAVATVGKSANKWMGSNTSKLMQQNLDSSQGSPPKPFTTGELKDLLE